MKHGPIVLCNKLHESRRRCKEINISHVSLRCLLYWYLVCDMCTPGSLLYSVG